MNVLVSTFGGDDQDKVLNAMKSLSYERLLLIGEARARDSRGFRELERLEDLSGHGLEFVEIETYNFMAAVDDICALIEELSRDHTNGRPNHIILNISAGPKLLGDAALFSAFRLGIEAWHCDGTATRLPVLRGATAVDKFSPNQIRFMRALTTGEKSLDALTGELEPANRQSVDRTLRQLKKQGFLATVFHAGKVLISLSREGAEVVRALELTEINRTVEER